MKRREFLATTAGAALAASLLPDQRSIAVEPAGKLEERPGCRTYASPLEAMAAPREKEVFVTALRVGISRTSVSAIAEGKRPDRQSPFETHDLPEPVGPPRRCPTCGGMVLMPCLLCHIRAMKRAK